MLPLKPPYNRLYFVDILLSPNACTFPDTEPFSTSAPHIFCTSKFELLTKRTLKFQKPKAQIAQPTSNHLKSTCQFFTSVALANQISGQTCEAKFVCSTKQKLFKLYIYVCEAKFGWSENFSSPDSTLVPLGPEFWTLKFICFNPKVH